MEVIFFRGGEGGGLALVTSMLLNLGLNVMWTAAAVVYIIIIIMMIIIMMIIIMMIIIIIIIIIIKTFINESAY